MIEENQVEKKNYWMYGVVALSVILILFIIGKNQPIIDIAWFGLAFVLYAFYLAYKYYILKIKVPRFSEMVKIVKDEESKRNFYVDDHPDNVIGEPAGQDYFYIRFITERITYILYRNNLVGRSVKDIPELQQDNDRMTLMRTLAEKGVTDVVET